MAVGKDLVSAEATVQVVLNIFMSWSSVLQGKKGENVCVHLWVREGS